MSTALVLGNGESRCNVNISNYPHDILIGCNAAHRDFKLDHIVCADKRTVKEAYKAGAKNIYTRQEWIRFFPVNTVPDLPYQGTDRADMPIHWGSGSYAVLLATELASNIILLGFDLYGIKHYSRPGSSTVRSLKNPQVNNVYKNTNNYSASSSHAVDYSYWVYQLSKLFDLFPSHSFTIVNKKDWTIPVEWQKNNVNFLAL